EGVRLEFSLGYLEDAAKFGRECFDLVFCRVCWYYCRSDRAFARLLVSLIKPGGAGYVECNTPVFARPKGWRRAQSWLNEWTWWKIVHPLPPHGRIAGLIQKHALERLELDYSSELVDRVFFVKSRKGTATLWGRFRGVRDGQQWDRGIAKSKTGDGAEIPAAL